MDKFVKLSDKITIPRVIIGLWQIADMEKDGNLLNSKNTSAYLNPYADNGFTAFDMADHYGSSEIIAGIFKNKHQLSDKINLFTKWVPEPGKISREATREAVKKALSRMNQTQIDLMQFHAWHYQDSSWIDALSFLKDLQEEGLIKNIGVTNFDTSHLRIAISSGIPIVSNQICYSLLDRRASFEMSELCKEFNIKLFAFGTLAGGFLSNRWLGKKEPKIDNHLNWSQMKYKRFIDITGGWDKFQKLLEQLDLIAKKKNTSIANISSRYILEDPNVASVIIGARLGENNHIEDHKKIPNITLSSEEKNLISKSLNLLSRVPGDCGDEYRKPPFLTASGDLSHHLDSIPNVYDVKNINQMRKNISSNTSWEKMASYSRAVKFGNRIIVSGTTATHDNKVIGIKDPIAQTDFIIDKIEASISSLGGRLEDIVRTRIFVKNINDWKKVAETHGKRFEDINPANTLVQANLVGDDYLVEIEAEAIISE
ncbi:MAG: aldo/keto reductase [Dehalococcoidales bacterium]|jgi:aryl-alcohol dehydrogenase-like predicted oxidoreductase/enamine deaminase RidA (YjgF/YER057c/UK114 family)|nr:aldo/keto reductase [Flavobacteriaceae bacterium]MDA9083939.1 aldo/keto reductase [Flavobacteriaceae bacterium]MDC0928746.1 aldo/keto reductase [Flavobacteriaceae bacterium]NCG35734.1 aldo/keto reductase [Dehalococcoidales bacterium]|tara:strand:+ start:2078 stop:3529 length:1452 start_codon:yes stop_codon:yes gene_type:complete